jgi:DNA ligase-1
MYTLYGKSVSGKIKTWTGRVNQLMNGGSELEIIHGYIDGQKQIDSRLILSGKNIGKSNETTPAQQAELELKSLYKKKKDEGYVDSIDDIQDEASYDNFLPMLAHNWKDGESKVSYPAYVQPKLDGCRMLASKMNGVVSLWSRKGKQMDIPSDIKNELAIVLSDGDFVDGEVYVHGWSFQRIISATKKATEDTKLLEYHIYDFPDKTKTFKDRFVNKDKSSFSGRLKIVTTSLVNNIEDINKEEEQAIVSGYEGLMFRNSNGIYKYKFRSNDLLKIKRFEDSEYKVVGGKEGQGRESGLVIFKCITNTGFTFDVRPTGTVEERSAMWKNINDYIGKLLTVKHQGYTHDGIPRFPVGKAFRPSWDV